ncbi:hypothetical protein DFH29DRAFT_1002531 [Suillus ampliporus]|nr:hypothetical protein DFH29DRAFT_1002531 [Suillus ampliporus]
MPPNTCANEAARCFRIHATPAIKANPRLRKQGSPAKFDMALLNFEDAASLAAREGDLTGLQVAQIRVIFSPPSTVWIL